MTKKDENTEKKLLSENFDEYIKSQIEQEIKDEIEKSKKKEEKVTITKFEEVPKDHIFSLNTTFYVFNRTTRQENYLNGIQAESLIGLRKDIRENLVNKLVTSFIIDNYYVKFSSFVK